MSVGHPESTDRPLVAACFHSSEVLGVEPDTCRVHGSENGPLSLLEGQSTLFLPVFHSLMWGSCFKCYPQTRVGFLKIYEFLSFHSVSYEGRCSKRVELHLGLQVLSTRNCKATLGEKSSSTNTQLFLASLYVPHPIPLPPPATTTTSNLHRNLLGR